MKPLSQCRLYTFVDLGYVKPVDAPRVCTELCEGGSDLIQLRGKNATKEILQELGATLREITATAGVGLVINDHLEIARAVKADICHLGQEDFFDAGFKQISELKCGAVKVGLSSHAPEQAMRASDAGADYIAAGPVFATPTKAGRAPVTLEYVRWAAANIREPWFAIGGITLENVDAVVGAGAKRICVVSAILNARNIPAACQQFLSRLPDAAHL